MIILLASLLCALCVNSFLSFQPLTFNFAIPLLRFACSYD